MNLRPEGEKVIVKPDVAEKLSSGGIIIPDMARDQQQTAATRGEIVAIGPDARLRFSEGADGVDANEAKPGQRVIFARYGGSSIRVNREEYRILFDKDIVCLIEGDEDDEMPPPRTSMVQ
jgi:chaperonin GroES